MKWVAALVLMMAARSAAAGDPCEAIPDDGISLSPEHYDEPMTGGCLVRDPLDRESARALAVHLPDDMLNFPGPLTQAHVESLRLVPKVRALYLGKGSVTTLRPLAALRGLRHLRIDAQLVPLLG